MKYIVNIILYITIVTSPSSAKSYSDSLKKQTNILTSSSIFLIESWQKLSHRTHLLDCQFENYCSKYSISAFKEDGFIIGSFRTTNKIMRCNPLARFCYSRNSDGYLIDDSDSIKYSITGRQKKSVFLNEILYPLAIVPGFYKLLSGKWSDAVFTTGIIALGYYAGRERLNRNSDLHGGFTLSIIALIYLSDVYWSISKIISSRRHADR